MDTSSISGLALAGSAATAAASTGAASALPSGLQRLADLKTAQTSGASSDTLGQTQFLTLFTTQLQNQNPLDPVKNEAFVAQLAQFSQLEATSQMRDSMAAMAKTQQGERFLMGSGLIGKQVMAPSGDAQLKAGNVISGLISLPDGADKVTLDVYDRTGQSLYQSQLGRQAAGDLSLSWDGRNRDGTLMPPGAYKVVASVTQLGQVTQIPITTPTTIRSVTWSPALDDLVLELDGGATVPLSQVTRVDGPPAAAAAP
jgi:flagellar basal-body rod modification protein FlgD